MRCLWGLAALIIPVSAAAHGFGRLYNLPVPFWLYAWAAASALLLSFLLVGYFASVPQAGTAAVAERDIGASAWVRAVRRAMPALKALSVLLLLLCIATGLWGYRDPYRNFSMTFFWVVFTLGCTYLTALFGNVYGLLNPWRVMAEALDRGWRGYARGRMRYPHWLGDWPALGLYLGFIGFELFGHSQPLSLARMLIAYSLINLIGVGWVGATAWFRHVEFFAVFFRLTGLMAPLHYPPADTPGERGALRWRAPFAGLSQQRPASLATVIFALAMLSTTAFDGLRATQWWVYLFWSDPTGLVAELAGSHPMRQVARLLPWYQGWETFWLLASPFLYFAIYMACIALAKAVTGSARSRRELALDFGYTLLPIAFVYHLTHYSTLILTQGLKIISLTSDPFGWGWNLFGTAGLLRAPILPSMGWVWHSQVGLILLGHIASVVVAHRVALRVFQSRRQALLSQLPMLVLMVLFTVVGLWILSQPLTAERMR